MANPQAENGHTDINHENLERLIQLGLNGTQWDLIMYVIRQTWGYKKLKDRIALSQFEKKTSRHRQRIAKELKVLMNARIKLSKQATTSPTVLY